MLAVKNGAQLVVLTSAFVIAFLLVAQAKPSPYTAPVGMLPDFHEGITTLSFNEAAPLKTTRSAERKPAQKETVGIGASAEERALFEARPVSKNEPAGRCSVQAIVFAKITLASACY